MRYLSVAVLAALLLAGCSTSPTGTAADASGAPAGYPWAMREDMSDMMRLVIGVHLYAKAHDGQMPATIGDTWAYREAYNAATAKEAAARYISHADMARVKIPDQPTAEWINEHASYTYIGGADMTLRGDIDWGQTVLFHSRLDDPYTSKGMKDGKEGMYQFIVIGAIDGHGEPVDVDEIKQRLAVSRESLAKLEQ